LEWYSAFYIWIRGNFSVVTGATLPNGHICSVGTDIIFSNRHIRSLNRDISIRPKRVVLEQTHPFSQNGATFSKDISFAEQTHPFVYHFQYWIKEFSHFFVSISFCFRPTYDLNTWFIWKRNWTCDYTTFIPNKRTTHSNHHSCNSSSRSRLKLSSNFPQKFTLLIPNFQQSPTMNRE